MGWADEIRTIKVRANADTPRDAATAVRFGAEGIGLTRTEHMFFESDRIPVMREMIMARDEAQRRRALGRLLPMQRSDFEGIFRAMGGRPVTIRLLDPPLHEFLPTDQADIMALATDMGMTYDELAGRIRTLHEINPMMGHRGCRLTVTYPEIGEMQTRAIIEAAIRVKKETGQDVTPEIMIPLVGDLKEMKFVKDIVAATADPIIKKSGVKLHYLVGTMIEVPRAALVAGKLAREAEFFSFGTNDLTQMTYGFSRDDAGKFLETYFEKSVFDSDPFARLDQEGVGELMMIAVTRGRKTRPDIKLGICGEHGGDPASVDFCYSIGLDYVSCSPYRVPIARLAAAQAKINAEARKKA
jgi:pyruvate,orthophosphate dikinase